MAAEAFVIRELTGSRREVQLLGRALPYRPVEFAGTQHYIQRWYPGNRVATLQVLGARESETEIKGAWKDRFMPGSVALTGFEDLVDSNGNTSAEGLAEAFQRLRIAGNTIEVRWGPEVRTGIIASFVPTYQRVEDISWSARFVWSQLGERRAPQPIEPAPDSSALDDAMNHLDDVLADEPAETSESFLDKIKGAASTLRQGVSALTQGLAQIQTTATVATARIQQVQTTTKTVIDSGRALKNDALDLPYVDMLPIDDVSAILSAEVWKREVGLDAGVTQAQAIKARNAAEMLGVPDVIAIVTVRENQTLRTLAAHYYGSSDSWTIIADANGFVGAQVAPGTRVTIPRAPEAGDGVRVQL